VHHHSQSIPFYVGDPPLTTFIIMMFLGVFTGILELPFCFTYVEIRPFRLQLPDAPAFVTVSVHAACAATASH